MHVPYRRSLRRCPTSPGASDNGRGRRRSRPAIGSASERCPSRSPIAQPRTIREHRAGESRSHPARSLAMFFRFPEDARWNADLQAVEFSIGVGEYEGLVRVARRIFRRFVDGAVTPERCVEAFHLQRTAFELIAERKLRNRQLTADGNLE